MRVSKQQVVDNRTRILDAALALFSEKGFGGASVAEVMRKAGMTHGGFYNHFGSKDELEVQACALAFSFGQRAVASIADVPAGPARRAALTLFIERYLSVRSRDAASARCPMVAFSTDVSRDDEAVQRAFADGVENYVATLTGAMLENESETGRGSAIMLLTNLIGALSLARSVARGDTALSDEILDIVRTRLMAQIEAAH